MYLYLYSFYIFLYYIILSFFIHLFLCFYIPIQFSYSHSYNDITRVCVYMYVVDWMTAWRLRVRVLPFPPVPCGACNPRVSPQRAGVWSTGGWRVLGGARLARCGASDRTDSTSQVREIIDPLAFPEANALHVWVHLQDRLADPLAVARQRPSKRVTWPAIRLWTSELITFRK